MSDEEVKNALIENNREILDTIPDDYEFLDGTGLLHWASMYDNRTVLSRLTTDSVNSIGGALDSTPLYYAIYNSNYKIMKYLLECGADVSYVNKSGMGPLHTCVRFDDVLGMILLLCYGADINTRDFKGRTLWEYAHKTGSRRVLRFFRDRTRSKYMQMGTWVALMGLHCVSLFLGRRYQAGLTILLLVFWKRVVYTRFLMYLNLFYTSCISYRSLRECPELVFQVLCYLVSMMRLVLSKPRLRSKSTHCKARDMVLEMIEKDEYTLNNFCYVCLIQKTRGSNHCGVCNRCVPDFDHHCPCVDRCIDKENARLFNHYTSTTFTTAVMMLLFGRVPSMNAELTLAASLAFLVMFASVLRG